MSDDPRWGDDSRPRERLMMRSAYSTGTWRSLAALPVVATGGVLCRATLPRRYSNRGVSDPARASQTRPVGRQAGSLTPQCPSVAGSLPCSITSGMRYTIDMPFAGLMQVAALY